MDIILESLQNYPWHGLLDCIYEGNCIPFIGPDAYKSWLNEDIASKWIETYSYPLEKSHPLAKISQFLAIENENNNYPKKILSTYLKEKKIPNFSLNENKDTPYAVLAELDLPIYITTNYDHCMEAALKSRGKEPVSEFCRWNEKLSNYAKDKELPYVFDPSKNYIPSSAKPLVYHLHGDMDIPQSMVLTEKDYFEFVINMNRNTETLFPSVIQRSFASTSVLFLGCNFNDVYFRMYIDSLLNYFVSVDISNLTILSPTIPLVDSKSKIIEQYLEKLFKTAFRSSIFWKDVLVFLPELRQRLDSYMRMNYKE